MITLTKDAVTLYDIETASVWRTMSVRDGEQDVAACYELGATVQEYETTDRAGNPIRVVLQIDAPREYTKPDMGGVYVFPRNATMQVTAVVTDTKKLTVSTILIDPASSSYWTVIRDDHADQRHNGMRLGDEWIIGWDQQMGTHAAALDLHRGAVHAARTEEPRPLA